MPELQKLHAFVAYVENEPGVLNRVASLFRRRGYNIDSVTVGHTEREGISRMTIIAAISESVARLVESNMYKLVNVISVEDVTHLPKITRSLAVIKVRANEEARHRLTEIARVFRARVVDLAQESIVIEITGAEEKILALVDVLRPFGILEMAQTGKVVMSRGARSNAQMDSRASASLPALECEAAQSV